VSQEKQQKMVESALSAIFVSMEAGIRNRCVE